VIADAIAATLLPTRLENRTASTRLIWQTNSLIRTLKKFGRIVGHQQLPCGSFPSSVRLFNIPAPSLKEVTCLCGVITRLENTLARIENPLFLPLARELRLSMREDLDRKPYNLKWAEDKLVSGMKLDPPQTDWRFNNKFNTGRR